jgi:hypothetical protein
MPSESGTPALLGDIESASPSVDNHRVDVKDPELQEIEVYDRQMKVFHTLASEVYTELNSRFYQLLVFIHEAHDIIAQLNKVGLFSAKDIRKWNNQRQYRMELERAELRMTRSKSSKIINDLSNQKESFLEQIRLNGDIDILHAKQSEDLASLRQKIGEYKATFIDFKRVIDLHTARIAEYPTFHDAVSADALNFGSLSYIQSQILSCEHYIMACEQSLMHAEARLQDPNIAIIDAKASKTNADRRDSALNLSVPNQEFQFLPFPEDTFT